MWLRHRRLAHSTTALPYRPHRHPHSCSIDRQLLGPNLFFVRGLVKFVPAVARLFCLALPGSFLTMFAQNKGDLCSVKKICFLPCTESSQIWDELVGARGVLLLQLLDALQPLRPDAGYAEVAVPHLGARMNRKFDAEGVSALADHLEGFST